MTLLQGKVAIITGSGRGIGAATAIQFARFGAKVVTCDLDAEPAEAVAAQIREAGGQALALKVDVTRDADIEDLIGQTA